MRIIVYRKISAGLNIYSKAFLQVMNIPEINEHYVPYEDQDKYIRDLFQQAGFNRKMIEWETVEYGSF